MDGKAQEVIEVGDLVRIVEDVDIGDDQDIIYAQDIQAVGHVVSIDSLNGVFVEFPRGTFGFMANEVYLVDVDGLHGEMEEMIAEEAAESAPEANVYVKMTDAEIIAFLHISAEPAPVIDQAAARVAQLEARLLEAEAEAKNQKRLADCYEDCLEGIDEVVSRWFCDDTLQSVKDAVAAYDAAQSRILEITAKNERLAAALTPFVAAAQIVKQRQTPDTFALISAWDEVDIPISDNGDEPEYLEARHLYAAEEAMQPAPQEDTPPDAGTTERERLLTKIRALEMQVWDLQDKVKAMNADASDK